MKELIINGDPFFYQNFDYDWAIHFSKMREYFANVEIRKILLAISLMATLSRFFMIFDNSKKTGIGGLGKKKEAKSIFEITDRAPDSTVHGAAKWMTDQEKQKTYAFRSEEEKQKTDSGIIFGSEKEVNFLGKEIGRKIYHETDTYHSLLVGSTRSGKTRRILLPSLWNLGEAGESIVVTDPKGELRLMTEEYFRKKAYNVVIMDFNRPLFGNSWNPLHEIYDFWQEGKTDLADEMSNELAEIIINSNNDSKAGGDKIWDNGAKSIITALILFVIDQAEKKEQVNFSSVFSTLTELESDGQGLLIEQINQLDYDHPAKRNFASASMSMDRTRTSFYTNVVTYLNAFTDSKISKVLSKSDHKLKNVGKEKTIVYLIIPDSKTARNVFASMYINQLYQKLVETADENGGTLPIKTNFVLDEFGNLPKIPNFDKVLTVSAGRKILFNLAIQGFGQLEEVYGRHVANIIKSNTQNWLYLLTGSPETAREISEKLGDYTAITQNVSERNGEKSYSKNYVSRRLLKPEELSDLKPHEAFVMKLRIGNAPFEICDLSDYKANTDFGMAPKSKNIQADIKKNAEILKKRRENLKINEDIAYSQVQIWFPGMIQTSSGKIKKQDELDMMLGIESESEIVEIEEENEEEISENEFF